jgi:acetyl esterase/lipase
MTLTLARGAVSRRQDANYGVRWLRLARDRNGDPTTIGVLGSSTGGHVAELIGMRPRDALRRDAPRRTSATIAASRPATRTRATSRPSG